MTQVDKDFFGQPMGGGLTIKHLIGFIPFSVWQPDWLVVKRFKKIIGDVGQEREGVFYKGKSLLYNNTASIFNPYLALMLLSAYCRENAIIYDPFAGGGTRGLVASALGYKYCGVELRKNEVDRVKEQAKQLGLVVGIVCGDAIRSPFSSSVFDFSYTCPPYYDLEKYSDLEGDLSNASSYSAFLVLLKKAMCETYRVLKQGSFSIWVVGNFRDKKGNLVHFSGDTVKTGIAAGFSFHDEIIFWGASGVAAQRACKFAPNKRSIRVHENVIVFRK